MIRVLGAVMVAAGCLWLGNQKARQFTARVRALEALDSAFEQMNRELELRLTPLPQLMEELGRHAASPANELFAGCRKALEGLDEEQFSRAWVRLVGIVPNLEQEDRRTLLPLGQVLGRYDGRGQSAAVATVRQQLKKRTEEAREDSRRLGRVYRAVGAAGGGFLIILLL